MIFHSKEYHRFLKRDVTFSTKTIMSANHKLKASKNVLPSFRHFPYEM